VQKKRDSTACHKEEALSVVCRLHAGQLISVLSFQHDATGNYSYGKEK
jgi:hypothetical protein